MSPAVLALQIAIAAGLTLPLLLLLVTLVETLVWWRVWSTIRCPVEYRATTHSDRRQLPYCRAIVLLTGTSDYADASLMPDQRSLLDALHARFGNCTVIGGHLPASRQATMNYVRWDIWSRMGFLRPPLPILALHNLWQLLLAAWCERTYGCHVACSLAERLRDEDVEPGGDLVIIGGSAGAQIALAAAPDLVRQFPCRITLIALGGVFGSPRGTGVVSRIVHLLGDNDRWSRCGGWMFPGRYLPGSLFQRRRQDGDIVCMTIGRHAHFGPRGYFGTFAPEPSGQSYGERTRDVLLALPIWKEIGFE